MASKSKQKAQGGGRKSNSEPRIQTFRDFAGCNFQLSPRDFEYGSDEEHDQTNLQMNYMVVMNNAGIADDKTIETRANLVDLFDAPKGKKFTGVACLVSKEVFLATDDGNVHYGELDGDIASTIEINDIDGKESDNSWTFLGCADDKLVGMTAGHQIWTGAIEDHELENAKLVPTPEALTMDNLKPGGSLSIAKTMDQDHPFRISLRYTYLNKYGPTLPSDAIVFYANKPTTEWSGACYLTISKQAITGYAIEAVELYYTEGEYQDFSFLSRVDMGALPDGSRDGGSWSYSWTGYLFDVSMWTIANLSIPTQNYTEGVPASKMTQIDGRLYFWGGDPEYRLWIGGNPGNLFSISTGVGGGFVDVEPGSGQKIRMVPKYKTQSGSNIVTILCDSENSTQENRHNLVENNITLSNEQSAKGWQAERVSGAVGCKSYHGAQVCEDGLYAISRYGLALTTLTMEYNSQVRVSYVSDAIKPAFTSHLGYQLSDAVLLYIDGKLYMTFGKQDSTLDNVLFCYDIGLKSWWTYTIDVDEPILNMINIDSQDHQEGIGIITPNHVYLLPTTMLPDESDVPLYDVLIESGELSTTQPMQNMQHLTQLEFRFDWFVGDLTIEVICIDILGRKVTTTKHVRYDETQYNLSEFIRIDLKIESYKIRMHGKAGFRMTHFMAKTYTLSSKNKLVYGFDSAQGYRSRNDIHPYFKSYNDIRQIIIP